MKLPTREEAQAEIDEFARYGLVAGSDDCATSVGFDCLSARASGELHTRDEFANGLPSEDEIRVTLSRWIETCMSMACPPDLTAEILAKRLHTMLRSFRDEGKEER